jgi:hypothetical protein
MEFPYLNDFQRDIAIELGIARAIGLTHTASANLGDDLVGPTREPSQGHGGVAGIIGKGAGEPITTQKRRLYGLLPRVSKNPYA